MTKDRFNNRKEGVSYLTYSYSFFSLSMHSGLIFTSLPSSQAGIIGIKGAYWL